MSALPPKADMCGAASDVRFRPRAEPAASPAGSVANALTFGTYSSLGTVSVRAGIMGRIERRQFDCDSNAADYTNDRKQWRFLVVTKLETMSAGHQFPQSSGNLKFL